MSMRTGDACLVPSAEVMDWLARLIACPSVSRASNLGLIEMVRDALQACGISTRLSYDAAGGKANLLARIGEERQGGLVLSGHTDVVPVEGQDWHSDPFRATIRDGRCYGRGAVDMKGFIATALALAPWMQASLAGMMRSPLYLALSYDEEVGCLGVRGLLQDLADAGIQPDGCIVGEPTRMSVVAGHKGGRVYRCCVRGREAHASLPTHGANAIEAAAALIVRLQEQAQELARDERRHEGYEIPHTTLQTGWIHGGLASNIVPRDCEFRVDIRYLPWTNPDEIVARLAAYAERDVLPGMRRVAPESEIRMDLLGDVPALADDAAGRRLADWVAALAPAGEARQPGYGYVGYGTEAGLFQRAGMAAVVCGPGSIEQAHKPDEYIELSELARCEAFLRRAANVHAGRVLHAA